jgi:hypothetical protein
MFSAANLAIDRQGSQRNAKVFHSSEYGGTGFENIKSAKGTSCNSPVCNAGQNGNDSVMSAEGTICFF